MVICCVPECATDSWKCDGSVTFYDFPVNQELKNKWIKQINTGLKWKTSWLPRGRPVLCSKHFLHTDFKGDTDALKSGSVPSVFGHKYIGQNPQANEADSVQEVKTSPLIVKVLRPKTSVSENVCDSRIFSVSSQAGFTNNFRIEAESKRHVTEIGKTNLQTSSYENSHMKKNHLLTENSSHNHKIIQVPSNVPLNTKSVQHNASKMPPNITVVDSNAITTSNNLKNSNKKLNPLPQKNIKKKENNADLIEIGPNTFLKINPDVIKVNKKQTPSGNTVLQFVMDQKLVKNCSGDVLPKLIQDVPASSLQKDSSSNTVEDIKTSNEKINAVSCNKKEKIQHVLGHVIDNHICEDSCVDLTLNEDECEPMDVSQSDETYKNISLDETCTNNKDNFDDIPDEQINDSTSSNSFLEKAPVLLTTNMPLNHCFIDRPKYILQLKQKNRQIASLKLKLANLNKKIEELEDRCIVQERQLSYSFVKRLKTIQKNAAKGDPCATYILEQIRSYSYVNNSKMRWSDSTLTQCAIWCRKAPYAYEYFKKAGFFKLPCLGTVKRFMKKHPEIKFQKNIIKSMPQGEGSESSSDFDFDESDNQNKDGLSEDENDESATCENILSEMAETVASQNIHNKNKNIENNEIQMATESIANHSSETNTRDSSEDNVSIGKTTIESKCFEANGIPITVDTSNLELQEIILPSGEVVQCYSSNVVGGTESGQYFIIPNVNDQNSAADHEYNVMRTDSMPVILQNIDENSQLPVQQDQLIFVAKSSDHVECNETEVTSA